MNTVQIQLIFGCLIILTATIIYFWFALEWTAEPKGKAKNLCKICGGVVSDRGVLFYEKGVPQYCCWNEACMKKFLELTLPKV